MAKGEDRFIAAVALVFGVLAWAQMPALCGFMLSSTLVGAANFIYSVWLGVLLAVIGVFSAAGSLMLGGRHPMLVVGAVLSVAFLFCALVGQQPYEAACRAVFIALTPE